jgi:RNA polymerase sigma-70 factor (ECF subfamily)
MALDIVRGQIASIQGIVNPDKLTHLGPVADLNAIVDEIRTPSGLE